MGASDISLPTQPSIPTHSYTNSLLNASQCEPPQSDFSYSSGSAALLMLTVLETSLGMVELVFFCGGLDANDKLRVHGTKSHLL